MKLLFAWLFPFAASAFTVKEHPLEPRCSYVYNLDIPVTDDGDVANLKKLFEKSPLLIIKSTRNLSPSEFIEFLTIFDEHCDLEALRDPDRHPLQILQPFDQFPDCKHVAPRGNFHRKDFHGIADIAVVPTPPFIEGYVWHSDLIGHLEKLPGVVTGFHIIEQPLIGGDTDFISGETVYEHLPDDVKIASANLILEINRKNLFFGGRLMDYSGTITMQKTQKDHAEGRAYVPLLFGSRETSVLIQPSIVERVVGWSREQSAEWVARFMFLHVLPHRFTVQWKKGDIGVLNNRRFIHSSNPARDYLQFEEGSGRLLLQTFLPTTSPLVHRKPELKNNIHVRVGWARSARESHAAVAAARRFHQSSPRSR